MSCGTGSFRSATGYGLLAGAARPAARPAIGTAAGARQAVEGGALRAVPEARAAGQNVY